MTRFQSIEEKIKLFPNGDLLCAKNGKYTKCFKSNSMNPIYIPKGNQQFVESLAAKKYYSLQLAELAQEIAILDKCLEHYRNLKIKSTTLLDDSSCYKKFLNPLFEASSEVLREWMSADYEHNQAHPEHLNHKTICGKNVRSKSEVIIANALFINKIPFRYECGISLDDSLFFPDFTICHPKTMDLFYWEHFGMMDSPSYCERTFNKLKIYSQHGILPNINLITTYETQKHPIDSERIQQIINEYFL